MPIATPLSPSSGDIPRLICERLRRRRLFSGPKNYRKFERNMWKKIPKKPDYLKRCPFLALLTQACFLSSVFDFTNYPDMEATTTMISVTELKRLLSSIVQHEHNICIRYRTIGQLWHPNFLRILKIEDERRILFHDETRKRLIQLPDISTIIQFELDGRLYPYEPNCHYQISEETIFKAQ